MRELLSDLARIGRFSPVPPYQKLGYVCGAILVLSGVFHAGVYLVDGGPWEGPVSWRKPTVFGLSFGIALLTMTWLLGFLRLGRRARWGVVGVLAVASLGETFLVSMQKWRGVASHFNEDTAVDSAVFSTMGFLVALVALTTVLLAVRSFFPIDAPASLAWAIRAGLVLMLASQAVGVQMIVEGGNTFGAAGALKVPHAVTLHAAQVLPALALALLLTESSERRRLRVVAVGAAGYAGLVASTAVQAYDGRGPLDLGPATSVLAVVGVGLLAASVVIVLRGLGARLHPPTTPSAVGKPPGPAAPLPSP